MTMTARQILANVSRDRMLLAREIDYRFPKNVQPEPGARLVHARVRSRLKPDGRPKSGTGDTYDVKIKALDPKMMMYRGPVEVSCTCGDHWSHWEVALHAKGAAKIIYSNGKPPNITNPRMVPGCCKHVAGLLRLIVDYRI